jgi:hypothetical protein
MAAKDYYEAADEASYKPERRTRVQQTKSPKASRSRRHAKVVSVPGMQQRRNKHWSW